MRRFLLKAAREVWDAAPSHFWRWSAALVLSGVLALAFIQMPTDFPPVPVAAVPETALPVVVPDTPAEVPEIPAEPVFPMRRELAMRDLLSTWGLSYLPEEDGDACAHARNYGLDCLSRRGSLGSLRLLDRPAILTLVEPQGRAAYATLVELSDDSATFVLDGKEVSLALDTLERRWLGEFMLLWRLPPFEGTIRPGDRGGKVEWLARRVSALTAADSQEVSSDRLAGELLERLKTFQQKRGLEPDGIVGPNTLIHLDSALGGVSPHLSGSREGA